MVIVTVINSIIIIIRPWLITMVLFFITVAPWMSEAVVLQIDAMTVITPHCCRHHHPLAKTCHHLLLLHRRYHPRCDDEVTQCG